MWELLCYAVARGRLVSLGTRRVVPRSGWCDDGLGFVPRTNNSLVTASLCCFPFDGGALDGPLILRLLLIRAHNPRKNRFPLCLRTQLLESRIDYKKFAPRCL